MKGTQKWLILAGVMMLLTLSVAAVSAAPAVPNNIPATAAYISAQSQTIQGNSSLWYKFDYNGNKDSDTGRTPVIVTLPNGAINGMSFEVYTFNQIADWWDETPVGRGTQQLLNGDNLPATYGTNASPDLTWVGKFTESGTYYVRVDNNNPGATSFVLNIQGPAVTLGQ
jgi:hypothetical protein